MKKFLFFAFVLTFCTSCSDNTFKDKRDNKVYKTIKIRNKIWMTEDLKFDMDDKGSVYYPNEMLNYNEQQLSEAIEFYKMNKDSSYGLKGIDLLKKFNPYLSEVINMNPDGWRYYNYSASKIACPEGWRLPSNEDWNELNSYLNDCTITKLDFGRVYHWTKSYHNPILSIRLGDYFGHDCTYWSSTKTSKHISIMRLTEENTFKENTEKKNKEIMNDIGICIRCLQDLNKHGN